MLLTAFEKQADPTRIRMTPDELQSCATALQNARDLVVVCESIWLNAAATAVGRIELERQDNPEALSNLVEEEEAPNVEWLDAQINLLIVDPSVVPSEPIIPLSAKKNNSRLKNQRRKLAARNAKAEVSSVLDGICNLVARNEAERMVKAKNEEEVCEQGK